MSNSYIEDMSINCGDKEEIRNDLEIMMTTMTGSDRLLMLFISVLTLEKSNYQERCDLIKRFNPATSVCLYQAGTWRFPSTNVVIFFVFNELI
jgi:hypothetical protein